VTADRVRFAAFTQASACSVELVDRDGNHLATHAMTPLGGGYFEVELEGIRHGALYWFVIDGRRLPDPYARFLPQGVHGPASVVVPAYTLQHSPPARSLSQQVIYELHVGAFTEEGTFSAASGRLAGLLELGVTTIELMPIAAFAGERGWGYDGVALYAPHAAYGTPDELRELIDHAHGLGLSVILDVVYNHFGPAGNYLSSYSSSYFSRDRENAWGKAPDFTEPALRSLVLENARYWLRDFGFDGLRVDATHAIFDPSPKHILDELAEQAHQLAPSRILIAEDERNLAELVTLRGIDALWADDFHHQLRVTMTGARAGYYAAFERSVQALADVINRGWLYTGQTNPLTGEPRGTSAVALPAEAFVYCIQNHDQIGNRAFGDRLSDVLAAHAFRAASLLLLFLPMTPLIFMGQEWAASTPFLYFTDHEPELGNLVRQGRRREFAAFPEFADENARQLIPDPQAPETFRASKLRWTEREVAEHAETLALYRAALRLRKDDPVLTWAKRSELWAEVWGEVLIVQRWRGNERRALVLNLGQAELSLDAIVGQLKLCYARALLESAPSPDGVLAPGTAIVFGGRGNLSESVEGAT
jgi:maltooligosyltrehalose trehalohydrolase